MTSAGNLRLRYVLVAALVSFICFYGVTIHLMNDSKTDDVEFVVFNDPVEENIAPVLESAAIDHDPETPGRGVTPYLSLIGTKPYFEDGYQWQKDIVVESGDTLGVLMEKTGLSGDRYFTAMKALKQYVDPMDVKPGQKISVFYTRQGHDNHLNAVTYHIDSLRQVRLSPDETGQITAKKLEREVEKKIHAAHAVIDNSLFYDLGQAGVPDGVINKLIKAYSWSVDFQRDIWGGEQVEVFYETVETEDGSYMRSGRLLYANLKLRSGSTPIYLFEKEKGFESFFEPNGQSIRRALLKTPVDGARMSSGYGMRKHPVLGYNKMHKGVDFAAPTGTPIFAAGDGVIEVARRNGGYGKYIRIRHNDKYKTAYAHMVRYAKGMKPGKRVKQGQTIGYVGSTGRSTGPHLHYEVHVNGRQVNPHSVKLPIGEKLKGKKLERFKRRMADIRQEYASVSDGQSIFAAIMPKDKPTGKDVN